MTRIIPYLQSFLILLLISSLIFVADYFKLLGFIKQGGYFLTNPISIGLYKNKQTLGKQFYFIFASRRAAQENKALKEQLGEILSENARLKRTLSETEAQLIQEQHLDPKTYNLLAARPIGVDRFLRIDKGSQSGVSLGQAVVFKDNFIGKIVQISEEGASVQLLTDPDSKVAAFSQGLRGRAKGVAIGQFGSELLFDKILHEEPIVEGDLVYSEGTEGFLPRGLVLGKVISVIAKESEVFKQAKLQQVFDTRDLELVFVLQN